MSQNVLTPATLDPATTDGTELATWLEAFKANLLSTNKGAARPSYAAAGLLWLKDVSASVQELYLDDGAAGILIGTMDPSTDKWKSSDSAIGKHLLPVLAGGMVPALTNGPQFGTVETATNKHNYRSLDFDAVTQEFACITLPMPKSWDRLTVTMRPIWTAASGSGGVVWALQGAAVGDGDATDAAYGTEQNSVDTLISAGTLQRGPESNPITIAGGPANGDLVQLRIKRVPADGSDTLAVDARLVAVELYFSVTAGNDE